MEVEEEEEEDEKGGGKIGEMLDFEVWAGKHQASLRHRKMRN